MRFLSHLDLLRVFKRAIKRAKLPLAYSHGFNPHPKLGFAQPLTLGFIGEREVAEIVLKEQLSDIEIKESLNSTLPSGISVIEIIPVDYSSSPAADLRGAAYTVILKEPLLSVNEEIISGFLNQEHITALKFQKKKGMKEIEIKDKIQQLICSSKDGVPVLKMILDCGSQSNLNPELVVESLGKFLDVEVDIKSLYIIRNYLIFDKLSKTISFGK